ncbi:MAG TPA: dTMP kinase [Chloroflexia bacterium]|nr:dTMP kinase [Chloroflexia bacterium]
MAGAGSIKRGLFIVLEGPDGAGISTQTALLQAGLMQHGLKAVATKEPTSGPIGSVIRQGLTHRLVYPPDQPLGDDVMALLYAADRLDHLRADIVPRLEAGTHVVCDRYRLSSYAYQGFTQGQEWVRAVNSRSIAPDVTFFIDVPPEVSQERIQKRGNYVELYETDERLRPIYANYLQLIEQARAAGENIITVDGKLSVEAVAAAILESVLARVGKP